MSTMMSNISDVFWRMRAALHNFWIHPAVHWIPASISAVWHWFHGVGSCGGHHRRMLAVFNMYLYVKMQAWADYFDEQFCNVDRGGSTATFAVIAVIFALIFLRIDRKRTMCGDADRLGYGSLIVSQLMVCRLGGWMFESYLWFLPLILPGPKFFQLFHISTGFMQKLFPTFMYLMSKC